MEKVMRELKDKMSSGNKILYDELIERSLSDRSKEWYVQSKLPDIAKKYPNESVLIRRAKAIEAMLNCMSDESISKDSLTAEIFDNELLLGRMPMGSNGLGKVFPNYLTEDEKRAGSITNRGSMSLLGHNSINYEDLVNKGLQAIIDECDIKISRCNSNDSNSDIFKNLGLDSILSNEKMIKNQHDFYQAVRIACQAVIDFANKMGDLALKKAEKTTDKKRKEELINMANIAYKVPKEKASNFNEALQSIYFYHVALHASMNLVSLGRLDQVLNPFLKKEKDQNKALELFENFIIKCAWRLNLNLNPLNIVKQDHVDNNTVLGVNPYLIDQKAGVNNFLQNIIIGGLTKDGKDATNDCTYLILRAFSNVNLSTPGIYVRIGRETPQKLLREIAKSWKKTGNNPSIINDEVMVKAMEKALSFDIFNGNIKDDRDLNELKAEIKRQANDFCVDGCWEPILNGQSDWTFGMPNALSALECALNQGALLSGDEELLRGAKKAPRSKKPSNFDELIEVFDKQLGFFVDQTVISLFLYYMIDEYACPSPLLSAFLGGCMEKGRDKSWGGTNYNLGGVILTGVPNVINTLAAIKKYVFNDKPKYTLDEVCYAFANNYECKDSNNIAMQDKLNQMRVDFSTNTPTFGNDDDEIFDISRKVLDIFYNNVMDSASFAKKVYEQKPSKEDKDRILALRSISGYYGLSLEEKFNNFDMKVTCGLGTFEQYNWMGMGNSASADRLKGQPLAPNFSPVSGTLRQNFGNLFNTLYRLGLDRFAGGVITDTCLESDDASEENLYSIVSNFIEFEGAMMTMAIGNKDLYEQIYDEVMEADSLNDMDRVKEILKKYAHVNVRIGGWQTPFVTLPKSHMLNYIDRPMDKGKFDGLKI